MKKKVVLFVGISLLIFVGAVLTFAFTKGWLGQKQEQGLSKKTSSQSAKSPASTTQTRKIQPPEEGAYLGVFPGWGDYEDSVRKKTLIDFEKISGKKVAFVPFSNFWGRSYASTKQLEEISSYGAIPMMRMMPWGEPYWGDSYQGKYSLQKIIDGDFDKFLTKWAIEIKKFEKPVMINFGVEPNGNWFAWSGVFQGGGQKDKYGDSKKADGPERFVDAYRHVYDLFKEKKVDNATWYFHINNESYPNEEWNTIEAYYPGDKYVDWVALSAYGAQTKDEDWVSFKKAIDSSYKIIISKFPNKPLMLAEWGVRESAGAKKAKWYSDALNQIQTRYKKIKIAVIYNEKWEASEDDWPDLRINSSKVSLKAYKEGVASKYFIGEYKR